MKIESLDKLLEDELKDLFNAENQLLKALPKMAKAAGSPSLKKAFTSHLKETEKQVDRLNKAGKILGISRPLVVRKMDAGKLPFHYVGAHRRCKLSDVLALKEEEDRRNQALRELVEDSEDLAKNHGL